MQEAHEAAFALGEMGDQSAVQALIQTLKDPEITVRYCAVDSLLAIMGHESEMFFIETLGHQDEELRRLSAYALGKLRKPESVEPLIVALNDPSAEVRGFTADALGKIGDIAAVEPLIELLKDPYTEVKIDVVDALGNIRDSAAVPSLIMMLDDPSPEVRGFAVDALGKIGDTSAVESIAKFAMDSELEVRRNAIKALCHFEDTHPVIEGQLVEALKDVDKVIRCMAALALGEVKDENAIKQLLLAQKTTDCEMDDSCYGFSLLNIIDNDNTSYNDVAHKARELGMDFDFVLGLGLRIHYRQTPWSIGDDLAEQRRRRDGMDETGAGKGPSVVNNYHNSIVNINSMLEHTVQTINSGGLGESDKKALAGAVEELGRSLEAALGGEATPEQAGKAREAAELARALGEEASAESPNRSMVKVTAEGLKEAARALADIAPTALPLAVQVADIATRATGR